MPTVQALFDVAAQRGGAADRQVVQRLTLCGGQHSAVTSAKRLAMLA